MVVHEKSHSLNDLDLWDQFRKGSSQAFEVIYNRHIRSLTNYGRRICLDDELVKDAIHDVFIDLWKGRKNLGSTDSIKYYLIKSYRRNLIKKIKASKTINTLEPEHIEVFELSPELSLIADKDQKDRLEQLHTILNTLSLRQKEAIFLRFYSGLNYTEISNIMGINPQSANNIVFRALEKLRKNMPHALILVVSLLYSILI